VTSPERGDPGRAPYRRWVALELILAFHIIGVFLKQDLVSSLRMKREAARAGTVPTALWSED
jgi:hypothetical protein